MFKTSGSEMRKNEYDIDGLGPLSKNMNWGIF